MVPQENSLSLSQFTQRIATAVSADPLLQQQWVVAETVEVRLSGGHCYMELIEKDSEGKTVARARATIWASSYYPLVAKFRQATSQSFTSGLKVMVKVTASFHQVYGLSLNITDIDPSYTMGDLMRRRMEILQRLKDDGILDLNHSLSWPAVPNRIAIISAPSAAGYGDFVKTLYTNPYLLRFSTRLFPAVMQGERTSSTVIAALEAIYEEIDNWDCVVIIRGGGSTADLISFDDYDLAANIAQFPIPVISGIGHERDTTVPDYVANMRVITPTDAAKWLIDRGVAALSAVNNLAANIAREAGERLHGCTRQVAETATALPHITQAALSRAKEKIDSATIALSSVAARRIAPALASLDTKREIIKSALENIISTHKHKLQAQAQLLDALSPQAVLRRGFSLTTGSDGRVFTSVDQITPGEEITTTFSDGFITSTVNNKYTLTPWQKKKN